MLVLLLLLSLLPFTDTKYVRSQYPFTECFHFTSSSSSFHLVYCVSKSFSHQFRISEKKIVGVPEDEILQRRFWTEFWLFCFFVLLFCIFFLLYYNVKLIVIIATTHTHQSWTALHFFFFFDSLFRFSNITRNSYILLYILCSYSNRT